MLGHSYPLFTIYKTANYKESSTFGLWNRSFRLVIVA